MKKEQLIIGGIVIAIALFFLSKKTNATPFQKRLLLNADWHSKIFKFSHPDIGEQVIRDPLRGDLGKYHLLTANAKYEIGWQKALDNLVVVTLLHKSGSTFSEVYTLNFSNNEAKYYSELSPVTITASTTA